MRLKPTLTLCAFFLVCNAFGPVLWAQDTEEVETELPKWNEFRLNEDVTLGVNGYLYLYHIRNANTYHSKSNSAFTEVSAGLGFDLSIRDDISGQIRWVGTGLYGRPENYLFTNPADMDTFIDLANVTWHTHIGDDCLNITGGLQELIYGDGFLIMDGYTETRAKWTTPIRSFPAIKASLELGENTVIDVFSAHVRDDFKSQESLFGSGLLYDAGGTLSGFNWHSTCCEDTVIDAGVFVKDENSDTTTRSDTVALTLRGEKKINNLTLTGEIVRQYGQTHVVEGTPMVNDKRNRRAWGGHITGRLDLSDSGLKPYIRGRFTYFGGDADSTNHTSEAFDPMFFGWNDWGQWWIGDMTSYLVPHSNARIFMGETGVSLTDMSSLRVLYFNTQLLREPTFSTSKHWGHELNVVYDYDLGGGAFAGVMGGASLPEKAAEEYGANLLGHHYKRVNYEMIFWLGFAF